MSRHLNMNKSSESCMGDVAMRPSREASAIPRLRMLAWNTTYCVRTHTNLRPNQLNDALECMCAQRKPIASTTVRVCRPHNRRCRDVRCFRRRAFIVFPCPSVNKNASLVVVSDEKQPRRRRRCCRRCRRCRLSLMYHTTPKRGNPSDIDEDLPVVPVNELINMTEWIGLLVS